MSENCELELYKLIMEDDKGDFHFFNVPDFGWISDTEFCVWVCFDGLADFIRDLTGIFGRGIFENADFTAVVLENSICIDLCEVLDGLVGIEEVFPKEKYKH